MGNRAKRAAYAAIAAGLMAALPLLGQTAGPAPPQNPPAQQKPDQKITPAQAKELFRSVDQILAFASKDSDLSIHHPVKRRMTNRGEVEHYILSKMKDDKDAARLESSEIVLKKFGLLDRNFHLKPFIVSLLTEQIAGYYDSKTKTVNMLDWIAPDEQKPVLAHELTHALQDQHVDLEKWSDQSKESIAKNVDEDNDHLRTDEADTAREAVAEGQAMVVLLDWRLAPKGQSLARLPDIEAQLDDLGGDDGDSPVMTRAPLLLKESLLFPYREGLVFDYVVLKDQGANEAFAGALDRPPGTSFEIMHPRAWEHQVHPTLLTMPDIHPLTDAEYAPYDIGVMGALDVRILTELFAGKDEAAQLTPESDGGIYYAAQSRAAKTPQEKDSTKSVALLYLSQWKSEDAAARFAAIYANNLKRKYTDLHLQPKDQSEGESGESVFTTEEGPVVIATVGRGVFISESFPLPLARKLELVMTGTLKHSGEQQARMSGTAPELTESIARLMSRFGMMRVALPH